MSRNAMHVHRIGRDSDPAGTILYVHGLGESSRCFEALAARPELSRWNHLLVDLIGYGRSPHVPEPLSLEQHAAKLAELLESEPEPVVVLGHSMGGVIGTILTEETPDRVRAFVNVEGNVSRDDCGFSGKAVEHDRDAWLESGFQAFLDSLETAEPGPDKEDPKVLRTYHASAKLCDPRAYYRNSEDLVQVSEEEALARRLAKLERPLLYVYGAPNGLSAASLKLLDKAGIKEKKLKEIPDAGHWPFLDQPDRFVAVLREFLDGLE